MTQYAKWPTLGGGGTGTVTSVALAAPNILTVSGSPVTTSGTLTLTLATQTTNKVFASPNGSTGTPTFRALVAADLPFSLGDLTDVGTDGIVVTSGTGAVVGSGTSIAQHVADATHNGYLSSVDWSSFDGKQPSGSYITALTGDGIASGPGSAALTLATVNSNVGTFGTSTSVSTFTVNAKGLITAASNTAIQIAESQVTNLVSDLAGKQPVGNYITDLTGDVVATGPGSVAATIQANVVSNAQLAQMAAFTLKGNNTGSTANALDLSVSQVNTLLGDILADGSVAMSAALDLGTHQIINVVDPTTAQMAATKNYVDNVASGLQPIQGVYAATIGNLVGTYNNGGAGIGATLTITATGAFTLDGTTPPLNSRILVKDQTSGFQNGVYTLTVTGGTLISPILTRSLDYNTASDMDAGNLIPVINGTVNTETSWLQTATITTVGTDNLVFVLWTANPASYLLKASNLSDVASASTSFFNIAQNASGASAGIVSTGTQSFAGDKTFTGMIAASNLSGTNTGDVTLGTANGLSLASQTLSLGLSSVSTTGALSSVDWATFNGKGSVSSVALTEGVLFSVAGSPITTTGTLALSLLTQTANTVFAGPTTGGAAAPTFRSIVAADITSATQSVADTSSTKKVLYVSQDVGNDVNDGSIFLPFKTIQAAINAANTIAAFYNQVVVLVNPSSTSNGYNENITLSQQGVVLQAVSSLYRADCCLIKGTVTINLTGTSGTGFVAASNIVYIHGFTLVNASGDVIIFSGTTFQRLFISDCYVQSTSTGSAVNMTNTGTSSGTPSTITSRDTDYENNNSTAATIIVGAGRIFIAGSGPTIQNDNASGPSFNITGANAAGPTVTGNNVDITGQILVTDNTANVTLSSYIIRPGSLPGIVTPSSPNTGLITIGTGGITSTATNMITGSGIVAVGGENAKLSTGGDIISTVTQVTLAKFPEGQTLIGAGATAVTNSLLIVKNGHITAQQSTAPTSALQTGAGNTATRTLTRCTDTAGNISITPSGTGIAAGAQLIVTFNKAYVTAPVVTLTANNANAAQTIGFYATSSTTTFTINFATAGTTGVAYTFYYQIIET